MNLNAKSSAIGCLVVAAAMLSGCGGENNTSSGTGGKTSLLAASAAQVQAADYRVVVQQLYISYFGRPADAQGLVNFEAALLAAGAPTDITSLIAAYNTNASVKSLIDSFGTSNESKALYTGDNTAFVTAVFNSILNRPPQAAGLAFWVDAIDSGRLSKGNAALSIMAGALTNTSAQGLLDAAGINNKIAVASDFTSALVTPEQIGSYRGQTAAAAVRAMLSTVTSTTDTTAFHSTVTAKLAELTNAVPTANAGTAQTVVVPAQVTLDGSASANANGDTLTYSWTLTSKPADSQAALSASTVAQPTFTADVAGTYVASLDVSAGAVRSVTPATVTITATTAAPPGAPANVVATAGDGSVSLSFTAPASSGASPITSYAASCSAGSTTKTGTANASPVVVSGLTNGTAYSCTVAAVSAAGTGTASSAVSATPAASTVACSLSYNAYNSSSKVKLNSISSWTCSATTRTLSANGVPDHAVTGGNFATPISAQTVTFSAKLSPTVVSQTATNLGHTVPGYVLNGVKLDPMTDGTCSSTATSTAPGGGCVAAGGRDSWNLEAIGGAFMFGTDENNAHVQPTGAYHYHGMPEGYITRLGKGTAMTLVGFALDGYPIYARYGYTTATSASSPIKVITSSYRKKSTPNAGRPSVSTFPMGTFTQDYEYVAGLGDLDECNGRFGVTPEFPAGIYHYYITDSYPYIQRCYKGTL